MVAPRRFAAQWGNPSDGNQSSAVLSSRRAAQFTGECRCVRLALRVRTPSARSLRFVRKHRATFPIERYGILRNYRKIKAINNRVYSRSADITIDKGVRLVLFFWFSGRSSESKNLTGAFWNRKTETRITLGQVHRGFFYRALWSLSNCLFLFEVLT